MDMFVPSLQMASAPFNFGPHPSIYESDNVQCTVSVPNPSFFGSERTDLSVVGDEVTSFANQGLDTVNMEDFSNLDNFENSNLNSLVDVLSRWQGQDKETVSSSTKLCVNAMEIPKVPISSCSDNIGFNPTLAELNTTDSFNVDDILGFDQESSKLSDASFDSMVDVKTSLHSRPVSQVPTALFTDVSSSCAVATSQNLMPEPLAQVNDSRASMIKNYARYFPPRQSNPPVGVVMPVMQAEVKPDITIKQEQKPHFNLEDLLSKPATIKSEPSNYQGSVTTTPKMATMSANDLPAQIVPNSDSRKRDSAGNIKPQGYNPASGNASWQDIESIIRNDERQQPVKRQRHDSGSSGHNSNDDEYGDDEEDGSPLYGGNDGGDDSDDDMSDIDADLTTIRPGEVESLIPPHANTSAHGKKQKPIQYFWQYNVQAKGPKGTRLKLTVESPADPHVLNDFEDPVFDECNTSIAGIRHGGKARKGDGNEITPNPFKLFLIGHQLGRLNKRINACCMQISGPAGNGVSAAERNASRKEKNKLASRACRLKKKAQHEANKIKLHGLALEHGQLHTMSTKVLAQLKERARALTGSSAHLNTMHTQSSLTSTVATQIDQSLDRTDVKVAGQSIDYVNGVILKVESGDKDGGLNRGKKLQFKS